MRIKFTRTVAGQYGVFNDGQIADLPSEYAQPIVDDRGAVVIGMFGGEKPRVEKTKLKRKTETPEGGDSIVDAEETV